MLQKIGDRGAAEQEDAALITVEGIVERIIYSNDANGYVVCELSLSDDTYITAVGSMPYIAVGESVKAMGEWTVHPSFGRQFKVSCFEKQLPATASTIGSAGSISAPTIILSSHSSCVSSLPVCGR